MIVKTQSLFCGQTMMTVWRRRPTGDVFKHVSEPESKCDFTLFKLFK